MATPFTYKLTENSISNPAPYTGDSTSKHPVRFIRIDLADSIHSVPQYHANYSQNFKFAGLDIFEQYEAKDYSVEFNDSVLDLQGWQGPRYKGCKTTGQEINTYTAGDVTYGQNANLENKTTAIYFSNTLVGGRSNPQYANIHYRYLL